MKNICWVCGKLSYGRKKNLCKKCNAKRFEPTIDSLGRKHPSIYATERKNLQKRLNEIKPEDVWKELMKLYNEGQRNIQCQKKI